MNNELSVRLYGKETGILRQTNNGKLEFVYNDNAQTAVSNSLPLSKKIFDDNECSPYFNGLLPENGEVRNMLGRIFGINANNDFSLLSAIGYDCAGALTLQNPADEVIEKEFIEPEVEIQAEDSLAKHIENLPAAPFFESPSNEIRLSLAGVQDKAAVTIIDGKICFPKNHTPTTHIIKPLIKNLKDTVLNEFFCMRLAQKAGINTANVEIRKAQDIQYLLIERYDRQIKDNKVKRIHQEDFCQALGKASANKYQENGGPGFKDCFELLTITNTPAKHIAQMMKILMFNFLIGNNDAHAKNFSLIYFGGKPSLAPAYDLISTQAYPNLTGKMAMKIGEYDKDKLNVYSFSGFCKEISYSYPAFKREFLEISESLQETAGKEIAALEKEFDETIISAISEVIKENSLKIKKLIA
ncbi:MAG: type II toxin-antitoxin system HipA family toxin [Endomicrobium sp.]|jgi:serine/threonine-protein kinase HipA|nr:type II toxin-antitoxin system HipA family toxin [Endomicrobium sp.]